MKKVKIALISFVIIIVLSIPSFASEGDLSLSDIFGSLVNLTTDEDTENILPNTYVLHGVTFSAPVDMQLIDETDDTVIFADDYNEPSKMITAQYLAAGGEDIDLTKEQNQNDLIKGLVGQGAEDIQYAPNVIDNHNTIEVQYTQSDGETQIYGMTIVVELDDALFVITIVAEDFISSLTSYNQVKDTIHVEEGSVSVNPSQTQNLSGDDIVIVDNDLLTMVITGEPYYEEAFHTTYLYIPVYVENHSDHTIYVDTSYYGGTVNGYEIPMSFAQPVVQPNSEEEATLGCAAGLLEKNGIETIQTIDFDLLVWDQDKDKDPENPLYEERIHVDTVFVPDVEASAPMNSGKTTADTKENSAESTPIVDNDILTIFVTGDLYLLEGSEESYLNLPVNIENHSEKTIMLQCYNSNSGVDGAVVRTITPQEFIPGGEAIKGNIFWIVEDLEAAGVSINDIKTITLDYVVEEITSIDNGIGYTGDILDANCVSFQVN